MKRGIITNAVNWRSRKLQGKYSFQGLPLSIENQRGSYRQGMSPDGHIWRTFMHADYGYIRLTLGVDGDHVDVYIGTHKHSDKVFIVHQQDPKTKKYDEDKCMLGYETPQEAKAAYLRQYNNPGFFQSMETYDMATFKQMLKERKGMKLKKSYQRGSSMKLFVKGQGSKYTKKVWKNGRWNYTYANNTGTRRPKKLFMHTVKKNLGGSTGGAFLIELPNGEQKVIKQSTCESHLREEQTANSIYETLGVAVPHTSLKQSTKGLVQVSDYVEGVPLASLSGEDREAANKHLRRGFVADALLGNWDVLGMENDNVIWDGSKA